MGEGCSKMHLFFCDGVGEGKHMGMQCLAVYETHVWVVKKVSGQGDPQVFHMHPYLMGAPRFQLQGGQGKRFFFAVPFFVEGF